MHAFLTRCLQAGISPLGFISREFLKDRADLLPQS